MAAACCSPSKRAPDKRVSLKKPQEKRISSQGGGGGMLANDRGVGGGRSGEVVCERVAWPLSSFRLSKRMNF